MISIEKKNESQFNVTVSKQSTTKHLVIVTDDYYQKLTSGSITKEQLIEKSFEFLLKRESNTMILGTFELPTIQSYFNEYESEMSC